MITQSTKSFDRRVKMKEVSPKEAYDLMQNDPEYIYLDVRSVPEFEAGHPARAVNIPIMHFEPGLGMSPNQEFVSVIEQSLPKSAKILIGCKTGGRSARACDVMSQMGFTNVTNIRGGFMGAMDNTGRATEPGWSMLNLPTCAECTPEATYANLASKSHKA
jgi:rhodanese-related sulfurtransferase